MPRARDKGIEGARRVRGVREVAGPGGRPRWQGPEARAAQSHTDGCNPPGLSLSFRPTSCTHMLGILLITRLLSAMTVGLGKAGLETRRKMRLFLRLYEGMLCDRKEWKGDKSGRRRRSERRRVRERVRGAQVEERRPGQGKEKRGMGGQLHARGGNS